MCRRDARHRRRREIHFLDIRRQNPHLDARNTRNHIRRPDRNEKRIRPGLALKENVGAADMRAATHAAKSAARAAASFNGGHASANLPRSCRATSKRWSNRAQSPSRCGIQMASRRNEPVRCRIALRALVVVVIDAAEERVARAGRLQEIAKRPLARPQHHARNKAPATQRLLPFAPTGHARPYADPAQSRDQTSRGNPLGMNCVTSCITGPSFGCGGKQRQNPEQPEQESRIDRGSQWSRPSAGRWPATRSPERWASGCKSTGSKWRYGGKRDE